MSDLRSKLPPEVSADFSDDELEEANRVAVSTRSAIEYVSNAVDGDPSPTARVHKGALVLLLHAIENMEAVLQTVTRNGTLGPSEVQAALDARDVDGFLNSL